MPVSKVIRYTTKPECADENERLIRDVFAELAEHDPDGLHYLAFRLADNVSFVHVAVLDGDKNPLADSAAEKSAGENPVRHRGGLAGGRRGARNPAFAEYVCAVQ